MQTARDRGVEEQRPLFLCLCGNGASDGRINGACVDQERLAALLLEGVENAVGAGDNRVDMRAMNNRCN